MNPYLLQHFLIMSAERHPEKEAIISQHQSITYLDLENKSNQLARTLARQGVRK
jgi:non-ribosomal peptide synthetase component E (peptide arylation enzyme)